MSDTTIAQQIEELRGLSTPALRERFEQLYGYPPRLKHPKWLFKRCAWKVQEQHYGGLSPAAQEKLEQLITQVKFPLGRRRTCSGRIAPATQTVLPRGVTITRHYKGTEILVTVVEGGFAWDGVVYRSLTEVARAVTGSKWNGRLFFKLTKRRPE